MLKAYLIHAEGWYNELTDPLKEFVYNITHSWDSDTNDLSPCQYAKIARELFFNEIQSNQGNNLKNILEQMTEHGIPLFSHRFKLQTRTQEFLDSGHFLKTFAVTFHNWENLDEWIRLRYKKDALDAWRNFKTCKERLVTEINRQIRRLS